MTKPLPNTVAGKFRLEYDLAVQRAVSRPAFSAPLLRLAVVERVALAPLWPLYQWLGPPAPVLTCMIGIQR